MSSLVIDYELTLGFVDFALISGVAVSFAFLLRAGASDDADSFDALLLPVVTQNRLCLSEFKWPLNLIQYKTHAEASFQLKHRLLCLRAGLR